MVEDTSSDLPTDFKTGVIKGMQIGIGIDKRLMTAAVVAIILFIMAKFLKIL